MDFKSTFSLESNAYANHGTVKQAGNNHDERRREKEPTAVTIEEFEISALI